ncbi:MAG: RCS-specific HTH-type transcriptional activator RclR [Stenotrophomonas maltophilia]|uniref:RCS-specific HTH-type transcriptional activator RclR n=1 Tax=Stenotrophomonas maltophilia TaxID=40324 RepID=A0A7V8FG77_STEMA|nr:MAG: RCS-specific HTH-type transcriptional activator RclR [Stenotrophomonas maltophilia]
MPVDHRRCATVSQITQATPDAPYLSLVLELDLAAIADVALEMKLGPVQRGEPLRAEPADGDVMDAALRLLQLLGQPSALPMLQLQRLREMHYWLLAGRHGNAVRQLGWPDGHGQRVARAIALLRREFAHALPVERLAAAAGMSLSSFHQHFRSATSLSPRQFHKQLRLIEARRLMLAEGQHASRAAFAVGYESVQQFSRGYRRLFGLPPGQDAASARARAPAVP